MTRNERRVPSLREQHDRIMECIRTRGLPQGETEWRDSEYRQWSVYLARVVECPDCAFTFGVEHTDDTPEGGYTCPACEGPRS